MNFPPGQGFIIMMLTTTMFSGSGGKKFSSVSDEKLREHLANELKITPTPGPNGMELSSRVKRFQVSHLSHLRSLLWTLERVVVERSVGHQG